MSGLYIWGIGCGAAELLRESIELSEVEAFVDSALSSERFMGKPVISPKELSARDYRLVLVSSRSCSEIRQSCIEHKIELSRVLFLKNSFGVSDLNTSYEAAADVLGAERLKGLIPTHRLVKAPELDPTIIPENLLEDDFVRLKTLELLSLRLKNVEGAAAELGVYKGGFARLINLLMPERRLYLFDSFEGFNEAELMQESCSEAFTKAHKNTGVELVLGRMPHRDSVEIRQGFFPASLNGLEERFAFVSLDVDLEDSTYSGLLYFVPRMNPGGCIFLHDYNSHLKGVRSALEHYEKAQGIKIPAVPLCDVNGTLVLCF